MLIAASIADFKLFQKNGFVKPGDLICFECITCTFEVHKHVNEIVLFGEFTDKFSWMTNKYLSNMPMKTIQIGVTEKKEGAKAILHRLLKDWDLYKPDDDSDDRVDYAQYYKKNPVWEYITDLCIKLANDSTFDAKKYIKEYKQNNNKRSKIENEISSTLPPPTKKQKLNVNKREIYKSALHLKLIDINALDSMKESELVQINSIAVQIETDCTDTQKLRNIAFNLKTNESLRKNVINGTISCSDLIASRNEELASNALKDKRKANEWISLQDRIVTEKIDVLKRPEYKQRFKKHIVDPNGR